MWHKQNAYNTPAMQMKRMRKAGLNPALMYGQGNVGNADRVQGYQPPQIDNVGANVAAAAAAGTTVDMYNTNKAKLTAETNLTKAQAHIKGIEGDSMDANKAAYIDSQLATWQMTRDMQTLKGITLTLKQNGFYSEQFAQAAFLLTGADPTKHNINDPIEVNDRGILDALGYDKPLTMSFKTYIVAMAAAAYASKKALDTGADILSVIWTKGKKPGSTTKRSGQNNRGSEYTETTTTTYN
jgi:hypothetical protein